MSEVPQLDFIKQKIHTIFSWRRVWIAVFFIVVGVVILGIGMSVYAYSYYDRVLPRVQVGDFEVGGMAHDELFSFLQSMSTKLSQEGVHVTLQLPDNATKEITVYPSSIAADEFVSFVDMNVETGVETLLSYGKEKGFSGLLWATAKSLIVAPRLSVNHIRIDRPRFLEVIKDVLSPYEIQPHDANVIVDDVSRIVSGERGTYHVVSSTSGVVFSHDELIQSVSDAWSNLVAPQVRLVAVATKPHITEDDVLPLVNRLPEVFNKENISLRYTDPHTRQEHIWYINTQDMANWLEVQRTAEGNIGFGLSVASTTTFLSKTIGDSIDVEAQDAKFDINTSGKVLEFQGSRPGITLDVEKTYEAVNSAFMQRTWHDEGISNTVSLVVKQVEPNVKTGEVNELGISEILGIGESFFRGSPPNRIKNIRHAVQDKLNGLLIKPDEEFSLVRSLKPFTLGDGYLPELVIKGNRIKTEIAGGLCQVGTTMFRAAMNSGLPITQRTNHGLVVPYYNDPVNGNPGTDATIYDPSPDFRFKNDTGHNILITTDMDVATSKLTITLWGTNDGRKGYFSHPVVQQWYPYGPEQRIETTEVEVGKVECQEQHIGAQASFTYTRELPNGEKVERVFESYYRPLPRICLVGVEEIKPTGDIDCTLDKSNPACQDVVGNSEENTSPSDMSGDNTVLPNEFSSSSG